MKRAPLLYATVAVLAIGAGARGLRRFGARRHVVAPPVALALPRPVALPAIALAEGDAPRITKIALSRPSDDDGAGLVTVVLEKRGDDWELTAPIRTRASASKVASLVDNLGKLRLSARLDGGTSFYDQYDLTETKALHIVVWKGAVRAVDLYCGKSSLQGQLVRLAGTDGLFGLVNGGPGAYAGFLYTRDLRSWRETSIFTFDEEDVTAVEIRNPHGVLAFFKVGDHWTASVAPAASGGKRGKAAHALAGFDERKVRELLRAYRSLAADDFGEEADAGVDGAEREGGVIRIERRAGRAALVLRVGGLANSNAPSAIKDSRWAVVEGGDGTLYALSPWTAGWATAGPERFRSIGFAAVRDR
jgi:hypothetical protein